jgi:hypothetical protein
VEGKAGSIAARVYAQAIDGGKALLYTQSLQPRDATWRPIEISLLPYSGQTVTLQFESWNDGDSARGTPLLLQYPHIDLRFDHDAPAGDTDQVVAAQPEIGHDDAAFDVRDTASWQAHDLRASGAGDVPQWTVSGSQPYLEYVRPLSECLANYTHLYIRMAATKDVWPRVLQWSYQLKGASAFDSAHVVQIPLLWHDAMQEYTYPIRLLQLDSTARLTGFRLAFTSRPSKTGENTIRIADVRLIGRQPGDGCH